MKSLNKKEIQKIKDSMECPKDFICEKNNFQDICSAEDIGLESFLYCREGGSHSCKFQMTIGGRCACKCQLRVYIAKQMR